MAALYVLHLTRGSFHPERHSLLSHPESPAGLFPEDVAYTLCLLVESALCVVLKISTLDRFLLSVFVGVLAEGSIFFSFFFRVYLLDNSHLSKLINLPIFSSALSLIVSVHIRKLYVVVRSLCS